MTSTPATTDWSLHIRVVPALAQVTLVALVVFAALSMAMEATFGTLPAFSVGPIQVYLFDLLLLAAVLLLLHEIILGHDERIPTSNRTVVFLVMGYCAYQIAVVFPVSVLFHDLDLIEAFRRFEGRLALILIPFLYLVTLKYTSPRRVVSLVNTAAVILALYVAYRYATVGPVFAGAVRIRELWGGATLLFGFLVLSSLFLLRPGITSYAVAILGLAGMTLVNHRSGYLALFVVGIPLFFHFRRASSRTAVVLIVVASSAVLLLTLSSTVRESTYHSLQTMLNPNADQNTRDRVDRSRLGWDYFVAYPLGDFTWNQRYYLVDLADPFEPHNFVVQLLDEQGIVGFAFFAAIIVTTVRIAWRNRAADRMSAVMLGYFSFYLLFCLFNTNIIDTPNILLLALPVSLILDRNAALANVGHERTPLEYATTYE
jgi:O-antigen ligase